MQGDGSVHLGIPAQDKTSRAGEQLACKIAFLHTFTLYVSVPCTSQGALKDIMFRNLAVSLGVVPHAQQSRVVPKVHFKVLSKKSTVYC